MLHHWSPSSRSLARSARRASRREAGAFLTEVIGSPEYWAPEVAARKLGESSTEMREGDQRFHGDERERRRDEGGGWVKVMICWAEFVKSLRSRTGRLIGLISRDSEWFLGRDSDGIMIDLKILGHHSSFLWFLLVHAKGTGKGHFFTSLRRVPREFLASFSRQECEYSYAADVWVRLPRVRICLFSIHPSRAKRHLPLSMTDQSMTGLHLKLEPQESEPVTALYLY